MVYASIFLFFFVVGKTTGKDLFTYEIVLSTVVQECASFYYRFSRLMRNTLGIFFLVTKRIEVKEDSMFEGKKGEGL